MHWDKNKIQSNGAHLSRKEDHRGQNEITVIITISDFKFECFKFGQNKSLYVCTYNLSNQHIKHGKRENNNIEMLAGKWPLHKGLESALNRFAYSARPWPHQPPPFKKGVVKEMPRWNTFTDWPDRWLNLCFLTSHSSGTTSGLDPQVSTNLYCSGMCLVFSIPMHPTLNRLPNTASDIETVNVNESWYREKS